MNIHISIFFIIEIIGTIAFASSGAMVAIKQHLDLLGVVVLGVTTAVGGGMLRDIILGNVPPSLFLNPVYVITAFITVMILFCIVRLNQKVLESHYHCHLRENDEHCGRHRTGRLYGYRH